MNFEANIDWCRGSGFICERLEVMRPIGKSFSNNAVEGNVSRRPGAKAVGATDAASAAGKAARPSRVSVAQAALGFFRPVTAAGLFPVVDAQGVAGAANHLVANTGKVAYPTTTHQHDRVLLEVVAFARDVDGDFLAAAEPHAGDFPQRRVRFLRRHGPHLQANALLLRALFQDGSLTHFPLAFAAFAD